MLSGTLGFLPPLLLPPLELRPLLLVLVLLDMVPLLEGGCGGGDDEDDDDISIVVFELDMIGAVEYSTGSTCRPLTVQNCRDA